MSDASPARLAGARQEFDALVGELRPRLHRYCARMTGSVIDGEDVVQDALAKAFYALAERTEVANLEGWLFRIAHNAALDFLRRRAREQDIFSGEDIDDMAGTENDAENRDIATFALTTFMHLAPRQRSCVILKDVLGYSIEEIGGLIEATPASVKAALGRGRDKLREIAAAPDTPAPPALDAAERRRLTDYIDKFNARAFDAVRDMLADDVRLELVARHRADGKTAVGDYFSNYDKVEDWSFAVGFVEGRPAVLVFDPAGDVSRPAYFILIGWDGERVADIRDFRYARYVAADATIVATNRS